MSLQGKIDRAVDIWVECGSLPPSATAKNRKYNEILENVLDPKHLMTEKDIDIFIEGHESGRYKRKERKPGVRPR